MTMDEAKAVVAKMVVTWPHTYAKHDEMMMDGTYAMWREALDGYTLEDALAGLLAYTRLDAKGFPPDPSQVIARIPREHDDGPSDMECVALIRRALRNSGYHAEEEFRKLPEICRRAVGNPYNLEKWAFLPDRELETVVMSQVLKALGGARGRMSEEARDPAMRRALPQGEAPMLAGPADDDGDHFREATKIDWAKRKADVASRILRFGDRERVHESEEAFKARKEKWLDEQRKRLEEAS